MGKHPPGPWEDWFDRESFRREVNKPFTGEDEGETPEHPATGEAKLNAPLTPIDMEEETNE